MAETFASHAQAMAYLADALPKASRQNPEYVAKSDGTVSRWATDAVHFSAADGGAVVIEMRESYTQTQGGKTSPGEHEAKFSLADVDISDLTDPAYATPSGEPARALLFVCKTAGCIAAKWSGQASKADKSDISIQDDVTRAKLLAAFRALQAKGS